MVAGSGREYHSYSWDAQREGTHCTRLDTDLGYSLGLQYLQENLGACKLQLKPEEVTEIRKIARRAEKDIVGERYAQEIMGATLADTPE